MISKADIESIFKPILDLMTDAELRQKTIDAWVLACERGGWQSVDDLTSMPFTLLTNTRGVNFIEHTIAVTKGAYQLAKAQEEVYSKMPYNINYNRLLAGGLLHDVGKLLEFERDSDGKYKKSRAGMCARHPISGTAIAYELGFDNELLNTIACHAKEGDGRPQVLETVLIHQADFATFNPLVMKENGTLIE